MYEPRKVLVTGGTGSFGKAFVRFLLSECPQVERVVVLSRDELKQYEMAQLPEFTDRRLRFFIGDVRDRDRLMMAMEGVDSVVHAAALKHVPAAEYNPFEAIKTNILGGQNVIDACLTHDVKRVVALSTDKACAPINLYGATKLCSDKLFVAANNTRGARETRFCAVRYGNVMGSRGSVIPFFIRKAASGVLPVTDERMTRFNITLRQGVERVYAALQTMWGGELFVPKIPSYRITDVAEAIAPGCKREHVGIRPGEKLHEEMITETDALNAAELDDCYVLFPALPMQWSPDDFIRDRGAERCKRGFRYVSNENDQWLGVDELRQLIVDHVDPGFEPWTGS